MSFLSALGKIGGIVAAPFTGGASLIPTALSMAGDVGSVLGAQEGGKTQGKITQAQLQQQQDRTALDRYRSEQDAQFRAGDQDLERKTFENTNRATTAKQALIGALLSGKLDPTSFSGGQRSGGLFDAIRSNPDAIASMRNMHGQADKAQMLPMQFSGGNVLQAPQLTPLPQVDKGGFLSTLARIGQIAGAASPYIKGRGSDDAPRNGGDWGGYG